MPPPIVIVGASQAGVQVADGLRHGGWPGGIVMIGEEPEPPYHRPPLSKDFLAGAIDEDRLPIRDADYFADKAIEVVTGRRVVEIDRAARMVVTDDGVRRAYAGLALTVGARPRRLGAPGEDLAGVLPLRTLDDVRRIKSLLPDVKNVVVVGGGFIGLECAAVARRLGRMVTVLEGRERLMPRVMPPRLSEFYRRLHEDNGVRIVCNAMVRRFASTGGEREGRIAAVECADATYPADLVVVGVGVQPNSELAQACGLPCGDGILVDERARTGDSMIVAAGDCANHPNRYFAGRVRLESVQNANDQARTAAATLAGGDHPYDAVPWFWSDQYDVKLQMAGSSRDHDREVVRGDPEARKFSVFYFRGGHMIGADSLNQPADHVMVRKLLAAAVPVRPEQAADPACALRSLL